MVLLWKSYRRGELRSLRSVMLLVKLLYGTLSRLTLLWLVKWEALFMVFI